MLPRTCLDNSSVRRILLAEYNLGICYRGTAVPELV